jgi:hypothetical protein
VPAKARGGYAGTLLLRHTWYDGVKGLWRFPLLRELDIISFHVWSTIAVLFPDWLRTPTDRGPGDFSVSVRFGDKPELLILHGEWLRNNRIRYV